MLHKIKREQFINTDAETMWKFISSPENLAVITPAYMRFEITSYDGKMVGMYPGQIIGYTIRPVLGIKLKWVTEITHVRSQVYFVDEQRFGPYIFWHHQHFITTVPGGIQMTDIVHYKLPFGFLGNLVHRLFVKKQLQGIFDYRCGKINELFDAHKRSE